MEELEPGSFIAYLHQDGGIPNSAQIMAERLLHNEVAPQKPIAATRSDVLGGKMFVVMGEAAGFAILAYQKIKELRHAR